MNDKIRFVNPNLVGYLASTLPFPTRLGNALDLETNTGAIEYYDRALATNQIMRLD
jgi:hypothetical protein